MDTNCKKNTKPIMVSINCIAYNHEKYIRDALEGFVMQKTNFRFEAIVHDDASTDGTATIIHEYAEKYPNIIKPIFEKENQYSKNGFSGIFDLMNQRNKGKYIAFCEGDDYWTDPYKLQKQIDFLESHIDYTMCCSNSEILSNNSFKEKKPFTKDTDIVTDMMIEIGGDIVSTCTEVYKKEVFDIYLKLEYCKKCQIVDYPLQILSSLMGKVRYMNDVTGVYRYLSDGSWSSTTQKTPIVKQSMSWETQIRMFIGLNDFSKRKYEKSFTIALISLIDYLYRLQIKEEKRIVIDYSHLYKLPLIFKLSHYFLIKRYNKLYQLSCYLKRIQLRIIRFKYKMRGNNG